MAMQLSIHRRSYLALPFTFDERVALSTIGSGHISGTWLSSGFAQILHICGLNSFTLILWFPDATTPSPGLACLLGRHISWNVLSASQTHLDTEANSSLLTSPFMVHCGSVCPSYWARKAGIILSSTLPDPLPTHSSPSPKGFPS